MAQYSKFTDSQKIEILNYEKDHGPKVAYEKYGISATTMWKWRKLLAFSGKTNRKFPTEKKNEKL